MFPDLEKFQPPRTIHLVGIGGDGMSSLAGLLLDRGFRLTGSESSDPVRTKQSGMLGRFQAQGLVLHIGHRPSNLAQSTALLVRSSAIPDTNPEVEAAHSRGIPVMKRAEVLGALMVGATAVGIAGTAGKTTTTAMLGQVLLDLGFDPTVSLGSRLPQFANLNYRTGRGPHFIAEADEFDRSFLQMPVHVAVITHLFFGDHPDCYDGMPELMEAFKAFVAQVPNTGAALGCGDVPEIVEVLRSAPQSQTYGFASHNDWVVSIESTGTIGTTFSFRHRNVDGLCSLSVPGAHNVLNAVAVIASVHNLGLDAKQASECLVGYNGCARRLELKGTISGITVYDDYGHHPVQIAATLAAVRQLHPESRIACIFEPRQFLRTRLMISDIGRAFAEAAHVIVTDVSYGLGESEATGGAVHARDVVNAINHAGIEAQYCPRLPDAAEVLAPLLQLRMSL